MSKLAVLPLLFAAACAPMSTLGAPHLAGDGAPRARIQFDPSVTGDPAQPIFPAARDLAAPTVDRMAHLVRSRLGDTATAELALCVSPDGHVVKAQLVRGSSFAAFDAALVRDAEAWQFATLPGPASLQSCTRTTVAYHGR